MFRLRRDIILCVGVIFVLCVKWSSADSCHNGQSCRLPGCFCLNSRVPPKTLAVNDIPQIVVFAFDGSVNKASYFHYTNFFRKSFKNSNGCPIRGTLFTKNQYTNHTLVNALYQHGFEIAGNSVTGKLPISFWKTATKKELTEEILNNRRQFAEKAGIPESEIRGWRSPHIQPTGDLQFGILQDNGFEYDSSLYVQRRSLDTNVSWPGTLQYSWPFKCEIAPCPGKNYSLWEVPVVALLDHKQQYPCMSVGGCINKPETEPDAFQLLWRNFFNFYRKGKVPFIVNMKPGWLNTDYHTSAMERFILSLLDMDDVYIVTMHQLVQWMKSPTDLNSILEFQPWLCPTFHQTSSSSNIQVSLSIFCIIFIRYIYGLIK